MVLVRLPLIHFDKMHRAQLKNTHLNTMNSICLVTKAVTFFEKVEVTIIYLTFPKKKKVSLTFF